MRLSLSKQALRVALAMNRPAILLGPPGGGKSSGIYQVAEEEGYAVLDWRLTEYESVDLRGTPRERNGFTYWATPEELPRLRKDGKIVFKSRGVEVVCDKLIVFLDEMDKAKTDVKNVAARFLLERRIGEWYLPDVCRILLAANRVEDGAGGSMMPTHLNNRMWHINVESSFKDWHDNFVVPRETGEKPLPTPQFEFPLRPIKPGEIIPIDERIVSYLKYQSDAIYSHDRASKEPAFASARSWHMLSDLLYTLNGNEKTEQMDAVLFGEYCTGCVGKGHGLQFAGFVKTVGTLVTIEQILLDPDHAVVPTEPSVCYALSTSLAAQVDRKTIAAAYTYLKRMTNEFVEVFSAKVAKLQPKLQETKAFVDHQTKESKL